MFAELLLNITYEYMKKMPSWDQKKAQEYADLMKEYLREKKKPRDYRDDERVLDLRDELLIHVQAFSSFLRK